MKTVVWKKQLVMTAVFLVTLSASAEAGVIPNQDNKPLPSIAPMLQKVMPNVVNIVARGGDNNSLLTPQMPQARNRGHESNDPHDQNDPHAQPNGPASEDPPPSLMSPQAGSQPFISIGSGVVVDATHGYILTNDHLLKNVTSITVNLSDGRKLQAKLIGHDPLSDLAVIQIPSNNLQAISFADSDKAKVGDFVAAIGNPFGLNQTVTSGIVSALQRTELDIEGPQGYESFIQTDASINPGNSGGALVNLNGELLGINTAILAPTGSNVGIGFAIPSNMAKNIMQQIIQYGSLQRGMVGVMLQDFTDELAQAFNIPHTKGAIVTAITPDSPAARSGIQVGDIINKVNDANISGAATVRNTIGLIRAGGTAKVLVLRNGKPLTLNIATVDPQQIEIKARAADRFLFGMGLMNFDQQVPLQGHIKGVLISRIAEDSPGWHAGLVPGDVVISANQKPINDLTDLQKSAAESKDYLLLNIHRAGGALFIAVKSYSPKG